MVIHPLYLLTLTSTLPSDNISTTATNSNTAYNSTTLQSRTSRMTGTAVTSSILDHQSSLPSATSTALTIASSNLSLLTHRLCMGNRYLLVTAAGYLHILERSDVNITTTTNSSNTQQQQSSQQNQEEASAPVSLTTDPQITIRPPVNSINDMNLFRLTHQIKLPETNTECTSIVFNASEEMILITTDDCAVHVLPLSPSHLLKDNTTLYFIPCMPPFHRHAITGLDTCIRKPYLITCGVDRTIRIWNYLTFQCELMKMFAEEPCSVSLHPCGMYVLVGFNDKLRLMNLLSDDLRLCREFSVRGCRECAFSSGGHIFAAAQGSVILIYNTWSYDLIATLKGHNGKIKSLYWSADDTKLISCGADGAVYAWNIKDQKRENEYILKGNSYNSAICGSEGGNGLGVNTTSKTMFIVGSDRILKEVTDSLVTREVHASCDLTQVVLSRSGRMMFLGTGTGSVRAVRFPLPLDLNNLDQDELAIDHAAHGDTVTRLRVSADDRYLFSASEEGTLYVYRIGDKDSTKSTPHPVTGGISTLPSNSSAQQQQQQTDTFFAEELLMTKSDLEERKSTINELKTRLDELKIEHDYQLRLKDMQLQDRLKELTMEMTKVIENLKISSAVLRSERDKDEARYKDELQLLLSKNKKQLRNTEGKYNHLLMTEYEKFQSAQDDQRGKQAIWQGRFHDFEEQKKQGFRDLAARYDAKTKQKNDIVIKLKDDINAQLREFTEHHKQLSEDLDTEIVNMTQRYEKQLKVEKEIGSRMNGENGIMKKKFLTLNKEIEDSAAELVRLRDNEARLKKIMSTLETNLTNEKQKMAGKDKDIQEQERRVYELKKKNQELEKFKFVLDFKIKDLKKQIEPREQRIAEMTSQINTINCNLEQMHDMEKRLNEDAEQSKQSLALHKADWAKQHSKKRALEHLLKQIQTDVTDAVNYIQDPPLLKKSVSNLCKKYCGKISLKSKDEVAPEVAAENVRQESYLRSSISTLKTETKTQMEIYRIDNLNMIQTNQGLIKEIDELRKKRKIKVDKPMELPKLGAILRTKEASVPIAQANKATTLPSVVSKIK